MASSLYDEHIEFAFDDEAQEWTACLRAKWGPIVSAKTREETMNKFLNAMPMACMLMSVTSGRFRMIIGCDGDTIKMMTKDEMVIGGKEYVRPSDN